MAGDDVNLVALGGEMLREISEQLTRGGSFRPVKAIDEDKPHGTSLAAEGAHFLLRKALITREQSTVLPTRRALEKPAA